MKSQKFKQTEIGKIPEDWKVGKLGDHADVLVGFPFKGDKYSKKGIKVLRGENVSVGFIRWDTEKRWEEEFDQTEKYSLRENDIVIGMDGSRVGMNRAIIKKKELPLLLAQRVTRLRANKGINQNFLGQVILSNRFFNYVELIKTGTSIPHISSDQISNFLIPIPSFQEQQSIASILSFIDEKIELNNKMNKALEEIGQVIFKKWFVDEKSADLEIKEFGDIIKRNKEQIQNKKDWENEYLIDLSNMPQFSMNITNFDKGSKFSSNIFKLKEYDILFGSIRPYFGKYGFSPIKGVITGTIFSFLPKDKEDYAFCLFNICRKEFVEYTITQSKGTKMPIIGWSEFQNYQVKYNKEMAKEFNNLMFPLIKKIKLNINQNQTLSSIRDSLLPRLMSGEIRVR